MLERHSARTVLERVAEYAAEARAAKPAPEVVHAAKRAVIDWFAATLPGTREEAAIRATRSVAELVHSQHPKQLRCVGRMALA